MRKMKGPISMHLDLQSRVMIPIFCPHCYMMRMEVVVKLVRNDKLTCTQCGDPIDLNSEKLRAYIDEFAEALTRLDPAYDRAFFLGD
jgi:hypothetical protein